MKSTLKSPKKTPEKSHTSPTSSTRRHSNTIRVKKIPFPRGVRSKGSPYFSDHFRNFPRKFEVSEIAFSFTATQHQGVTVTADRFVTQRTPHLSSWTCLGYEEGVAIQRMGREFFITYFRMGDSQNASTKKLVLIRSALVADCECILAPILSLNGSAHDECAEVVLEWVWLNKLELSVIGYCVPYFA